MDYRVDNGKITINTEGMEDWEIEALIDVIKRSIKEHERWVKYGVWRK